MTGTYSLKDVMVSIVGPSGGVLLGGGLGGYGPDDAIKVEPVNDKNTMTVGADGSVMHSLLAGEASTVTLTLLKTATANTVLMAMYNVDTQSGAIHGKNTIAINDVRGDAIANLSAAFKRRPDFVYNKEGGTMVWTWDAGLTVPVLGTGVPTA